MLSGVAGSSNDAASFFISASFKWSRFFSVTCLRATELSVDLFFK